MNKRSEKPGACAGADTHLADLDAVQRDTVPSVRGIIDRAALEETIRQAVLAYHRAPLSGPGRCTVEVAWRRILAAMAAGGSIDGTAA